MRRILTLISLVVLMFVPPEPTFGAEPAAPPLRVGVTLHPYYSWVSNVVRGTGVEVRNVLPGEVDAGDYQPRPEDVQRLRDLDALVVNGLGHDDFIQGMAAASGNTRLHRVRINEGTALLRGAHGEAANSHTFLSFTNAIQQSYLLARELGKLRPALAPAFQSNAQDYARRLRAIKAGAATALASSRVKRVVTVHDGYSYLLQEFGLDLAGVVQPAHGLVPSAKELQGMIDLMRRERIQVVLTEESFPPALLKTLTDATAARVQVIGHVARGAYTPEKFEVEMKANAEALVVALAGG